MIRFGLVLTVLLLPAVVRAANGIVDLSWGACTPVVSNISTTTPGPYSLYVSEDGNNVVHQAYQVRVIYGDVTASVPDAWRFDAPGCQGSAFLAIDHLAPAAVVKVCPSFQGNTQSLQIKDCAFTPPTDPYSTTTMRLVLADAYPAGNTGNGGRMFLARFLFDHTFSVSGQTDPGVNCGGFESSVCFQLTVATYLDTATPANEIPFDKNVPINIPVRATFNGGAACIAVPAKAATWGGIKGQYRN